MTGSAPARDALDDKVNRLFAGKVVRKDLVRKVKVGANVPVFVLEFLLGKYCASSDEVAIQMGLQVVNDTLANNYIRSDESMKAQATVKDRGKHTFIDKVKVRLVDSDYWAEVTNFGHKNVHIPEHYVRDYERLVMGGVWAHLVTQPNEIARAPLDGEKAQVAHRPLPSRSSRASAFAFTPAASRGSCRGSPRRSWSASEGSLATRIAQ